MPGKNVPAAWATPRLKAWPYSNLSAASTLGITLDLAPILGMSMVKKVASVISGAWSASIRSKSEKVIWVKGVGLDLSNIGKATVVINTSSAPKKKSRAVVDNLFFNLLVFGGKTIFIRGKW